jgi:hypothetical protein
MKRTRAVATSLAIALSGEFFVPSIARAERGCGCGWGERRPYGCPARGEGWGRYGAKDPVKSAEEARKRLEVFYDDENLVVGKPVERPLYFEASIKHKDGRLVDRVIVDKRSGRIRSIL